jgi:hypothetical protein
MHILPTPEVKMVDILALNDDNALGILYYFSLPQEY